jgi:hypothetical protein
MIISGVNEFVKKVEMILMDYSGAPGTPIHEKKRRSKISCLPFIERGNLRSGLRSKNLRLNTSAEKD